MRNGNASMLIMGGACRRSGSRLLVDRRSWEMLRLFSDQVANPVFAMQESPGSRSLTYALPRNACVIPYSATNSIWSHVRRLIAVGSVPLVLREAILTADVVYLRFPSWPCCDAMVHCIRLRKKLISSLHGDWEEVYRSVDAKGLRKVIARVMAKRSHKCYLLAARTSQAIFCVGNRLENRYGPYSKAVHTFANYLHEDRDIASPMTSANRIQFEILYVGCLEPRKGLRYLLEAIAILISKGLDVTLKLVGEGSQRADLGALALALGISNRVEFRGYMQYGGSLLSMYREADVLVLPSIAGEGLPKVVMEAMSQGVVVVATDIGSTRDMLDGNKRGVSIAPASALEIANAIELLLSNPNLCRSLQCEGLLYARENTRSRQMTIIRQGLMACVPDVLGSPQYLESIGDA